MKKITVLGALMLLPMFAFAEGLTAYEIASRAYNQESGKTSFYEASLTIQAKSGGSRVREISLRKKLYDGVKKTLITFSAPKEVAGVAYLSFEYDSKKADAKESENWLYMPAMKKVRRISGSSRQDDFMGSDFTYEDIGDRGLNKDNFTLMGEEKVDGADCWKLDCASKDSSEKIPRRILWVRKDNYIPQKVQLFDQRGELQRELVCSDIKQVDGFWTVNKMVMTNVQTGHFSTIQMKSLKHNIDLADNLFTVSSIERGIKK